MLSGAEPGRPFTGARNAAAARRRSVPARTVPRPAAEDPPPPPDPGGRYSVLQDFAVDQDPRRRSTSAGPPPVRPGIPTGRYRPCIYPARRTEVGMRIGRVVIVRCSFAAAVVCAEGLARGPVRTGRGQPGAYETVRLTLPRGDAAAGRQLFLDLRCAACHRAAGDTGFPDPISSTPGPVLFRA